MAQYTVTGSTSVVLVNSLQTPNTVVLLSSIQYPGHIVGIRDTTGSPEITWKPILISTMSGLKFYDGTSTIAIKQPFGYAVVSSKDNNTWQLLNTAGFFTSLSNAYLNTLTSQFSYINLLSSPLDVVSTATIKSIDITNSIFLGGNAQIIGDIVVNGPVSFLSVMTVENTLSLSSFLTVQRDFVASSSLSITGDVVVGGYMSTLNDLYGQEALVDQEASARGLLLPQHLSVQTLRVGLLDVGGGIQAAQTVSSMSHVSIGQELIALGSTFIGSSVSLLGNVGVGGGFYSASNLQTQTLSTLGFVTIRGQAIIEGSLTVFSSVSSLADVQVQHSTFIKNNATFVHDAQVTGLTEFRELNLLGNLEVSSITALSSVAIRGDALSYGTLFRTDSDLVMSTVGVGESLLADKAFVSFSTGISTLNDFGVGQNLTVGGLLCLGTYVDVQGATSGVSSFYVLGNLSTSYLNVYGDLQVVDKLHVGQVLGASTLGAPIDLSISTLTLSNTFYVNSYGKVPLLDIEGYPRQILVGGTQESNYVISVEGVLQNQSTLDQGTFPDYTKLWYATKGIASSIVADVLVSSYTVGPQGATKPLQTFHGAVLTGQFATVQNLFYSSNVSTSYQITNNRFLGNNGGYKVTWNGSNQWVAVGDGGLSGSNFSILSSDNGYVWAPAASGGFTIGGRSIAYGGGQWIAVGYTILGGTIQYSLNGLSWTNAVNTFNNAGGGDDIAYNGSNLWVAAGTNAPAAFGIKYSANGSVWFNATLTPPLTFACKAVGFGNGRWVASDGVNRLLTSVNGANWTLLGQPLGKLSISYNGSIWVAGGPATTFNPLTSIHWSSDGVTWIPITSGGFTDSCYKVQWDAVKGLWLATGATSPISTDVLQYSEDGLNWSSSGDFPDLGTARGIGVGTIQAPDSENYFTVNMTTLFRSTLSSVSLYASSITVSSIQSASFFGDGAGVSNIINFRSSVLASSFLASNAYVLDVSAQRIQSEFAFIKDSLQVIRNPFLSSIDLWIAAGYDSQSNGNIQTSYTGLQWQRGVGTNFNYFAKSVTGNSNISSPLYVATGADSRTQYTIQWSENGRLWYPINQGGFDEAVSGVRTGNSVAYNTLLNTWVAAGFNPGTTSTLFYSTDAKNWTCGINGFTDSASYVAASPTGFIALGDGIKYSGDGITWNNSATSLSLDTASYGLLSTASLTTNLWIGVSNTSLYISQDNGVIWQTTGSNSLYPITSLIYSASNWIGVGGNKIQYSQSGLSWSNITTQFSPDVNFNAVVYNSNQARWVAGAVSTTADKSLWNSTDIFNWTSAQSGGFSTSIIEEGKGYSIFTSSTYTFAAGKGSFTGVTPPKQTILQVTSNGAGSYTTSPALSLSNSDAVFESLIRGIAGSANETYAYVAVGDGTTPQKTIARSVNAQSNSWLPAITGGFSTTGYGVTHYKDIWLATGDAQASSNTIQYSPDGASWFGTNNAAAMRIGGRGIGLGYDTLSNMVIAVGKDTGRSTIVYSSDGYNWTPAIGAYFATQGNAVTGGSNLLGPNFVAVGQDARGFRSTILRSQDGISWSNALSGGFTGGGFGVAYGLPKTYVAVGIDTNSNKTIQYSTDGGANFAQVVTGAFTKAGYGVAFNTLSNLYFAVGEDIAATRNRTIKYSGDAFNWSNISTGSGFLSQTTLGAAYSLYTQPILNGQINPYIEFSNLMVYEGEDPLLYPLPTIRAQSSFVAFNEALKINLSTQVFINSNSPYNASTVLTVNGNIYASSLLYTGEYIITDTLFVSSLIVSTLSSITNLNSIYFTTPQLAFNTHESKPNFISTFADSIYNYEFNTNIPTNIVGINDTLFVTANVPTQQKVGIGISTPLYDLDIKGSFGTSSFSTSFVFAPGFVQQTSQNGIALQDNYFTVYNGPENTILNASNSMLVAPSSLTLNSIVTLNLSTQRVGIFTKEPQFSLDVSRQAYIQSVSTPLLNTSLLFLTLQSV